MAQGEDILQFSAKCIEVPRHEPPVQNDSIIGVVELVLSQGILRWKKKADSSAADYSVPVSSLKKSLKRKNEVKFLTSTSDGGSGYAFAVYSRDNKQQPSEEERERLRKQVKKLMSAPAAKETAPSGSSSSTAANVAKRGPEESTADDTKLSTLPPKRRKEKESFLRQIMSYEEEKQLREAILRKNEKVKLLYEKLVQGTQELTEDEFWAEREQLLFDEHAKKRERPLPSALPDERSKVEKNTEEFSLTKMQMRQVLVRDPALKRAYEKYCRTGVVSVKEFWTTYFEIRIGKGSFTLNVEDDTKHHPKRREAVQYFQAYKEGRVDENGNILEQHDVAAARSGDAKKKRKQLSQVSEDVNLVHSLDDVAYSEVPSKFSIDPGPPNKYSRTDQPNRGVSNYPVDQWRGGFGTGEHARAYEGFVPQGVVGPRESREISQKNKQLGQKADRLIKEHNRYSGVVVEGGIQAGQSKNRVSASNEERINEELDDLKEEKNSEFLPLQVDKHKVMSHITGEQSAVPTTAASFHHDHGLVVASPLSSVTSSKILDTKENGITPLVLTLGFMNDAYNRASLQKLSFQDLIRSLPQELSFYLKDIVQREPEMLKTFWRLHSQYQRANRQRFGEVVARIADLYKSVTSTLKSIEENTDTESKKKMLHMLDSMKEQLESAITAYCSKTGTTREQVIQSA